MKYDEYLMLEDLEAAAYYPEEDYRDLALFEYPNALNFDEWGIFIPEMEIPEHLADRLTLLLEDNVLGWILGSSLDLLTYFGTPLGEAVEGYDDFLVGECYPQDLSLIHI